MVVAPSSTTLAEIKDQDPSDSPVEGGEGSENEKGASGGRVLLLCREWSIFFVCGCVGDAEFAAAVLLVVEVVFAEELVAAVLESSFPPVLCPEGGAWDGLLGGESCLADLLEAFPAGGGEGGGEVLDAECLCLEGGGGEADAEALEASGPSFGFLFQSLYLLEPACMVVVAVYPSDAEAVGMSFAFVFADVVFLTGVDVGVEVEDGGTDVVLEHPFDDGGGAGCATGVEKDFVEPFWYLYVVLFLHLVGFLWAKLRLFRE